MASAEEFEAARARGLEESKNFAAKAKLTGTDVVLVLHSGQSVIFPTERAAALAEADRADLAEMCLVGGGAGLHFPRLNVTYYVPGLARGVFGPAPEGRSVAAHG